MVSHYLMREIVIGSMCRALAPFDNIDLAGFRLACYRAAGIAEADALAHDAKAYRCELLRRRALAAYRTAGRGTYLGIVFGLVAVPSVAEARPVIAPEHEWPILAAAGLLMFGAPLLLIAATIVLKVLENRRRPLPKAPD